MNFLNASEGDLVEWMAIKECPDDARAAFGEFHRRHARYLFAACERKYGIQGLAEDIVCETLIRVFGRAASFDLTRLDGDGEADRNKVRAWLGRVAHNAAADFFAARNNDPATRQGTAALPSDGGATDERDDEPETEAWVAEERAAEVRRVVESLPEREREIAWVIAHNWRPGGVENPWSADDLNYIADRFGLTRENIRQIKCRLIQKLRKLLAVPPAASVSAR